MSETVTASAAGVVWRKAPTGGWECSDDGKDWLPWQVVPWQEEVLLALATAQRERAEWEANAQELREERDTLRERVTASANGMCKLNDRIAALEAEAQDVKRVEAWLHKRDGNNHVFTLAGKIWAVDESAADDGQWKAPTADSLAALGRMLKEGE